MAGRGRQRPSGTAIARAVAAIAALGSMLAAADAPAAGPTARRIAAAGSPSSCDAPPFHELDFWIGAWQVFDANKMQLVAFDRIEKRAAGCIVEEHLNFLTDLYRRPGVARRLAGISISRFDGERWLQMWADNQWGAIELRSVAASPGRLVFETSIPSRGRDVRIVYRRLPNGDVAMHQYVAPAGSGRWALYGNLLYRPNR